MNEISLFINRKARLVALAVVVTLMSSAAFGQSFVGRNANAVGPTPDGFYKGLPHYQDNEPSCKLNVLRPRNIICAWDGYNGADDVIGDAWVKLGFSNDNGRTWLTRYATGSNADLISSIGQQFAADPITICWAGGCGVVMIASTRLGAGGSGGGVYMQLLPEFNIEAGFSHLSEQGLREVRLGTGGNFLDKIDAIFMPETQNPGTIEVTMNVEKGNGETELITRQWPKGRILVVYASINSSQQNIRVYSTYSDDFGLSWSPPKQVANTTGLDSGVAVSAIGNTVMYAYRQFSDESGDNPNAIYGAVSRNGGKSIGQTFPIVSDYCAFDQPTLPNANNPSIAASRTNGFVSLSNNNEFFAMTYQVRRRAPGGGCLTEPFDYPSDSRIMLVTSPANGQDWGAPVPIAPRDEHGFQFMPTIECSRAVCQTLYYDTSADSARAISFLEARDDFEARDAFVNLPLFADFNFGRLVDGVPEVVQFRRTADVMTRQFELDGNGDPVFLDAGPVRVSRYQLALIDGQLRESGSNPFHLKVFKANTVSYMGDYIDLATEDLRAVPNPGDPSGPPIYESNRGIDPLNPAEKPKFLAVWADARNQRGQLYTGNVEEALPYQKTARGQAVARNEDPPEQTGAPELLPGGRDLSAEGVDDSNPGAGFCARVEPLGPGQQFFAINNRIKDSDIYSAWIEDQASAWVFNPNKDLGVIPRSYVLAARNESTNARTFRFEIVNQPIGHPEFARAAWNQLPTIPGYFDSEPLTTVITEPVGPQSSVSVALFLVSQLAVNPVTIDITDDATGELIETITVNGAQEAGSFLNPDGTINEFEIHNPDVVAPGAFFDPDIFNPDVFNPDVFNPDVFNPDVFNPDVFNPDVFNPDVFNPDVFNPDVFNPDVFNPDVFNPDVFNVSLVDSDNLDNPEIADPDLDSLGLSDDEQISKFDVAFSVFNLGNTLTPYTADFEVASPLILELIADGEIANQLIVSQQAQSDDYQFCEPRSIPQNRVVAVANNINLSDLSIPDISNNRFGSITFYIAPGASVTLTLRFLGRRDAIKEIAPELANDVISHVVTSQIANTFEFDLAANREQNIRDVSRAAFNVAEGETIVLEAQGPSGATLPADLVTASKDGIDVPVDCAPALGSVVPLGATAVSCSATASNGITATVDFTVSVEDSIAPTIDPDSVPDSQTIARTQPAGSVFGYTPPTAWDVVDQDVDVVCSPGPGELFPFTASGPSLTTVNCIATDDAGLTDQASFDITVEDTTAPELSIPIAASADATSAAGAAVTFSPIPSALDLGVTVVPVSCVAFDPPVAVTSGSQFPIGNTTVTCIATDDAGNSAAGQFVVSVTDSSSPTIDTDSVPTSPFEVEANSPTGYQHPPGDPPLYEVTASDTVDGAIAASCSPDGTSDFTFGTTPVSCSAFDSTGNESPSVGFDVAVDDTTPPQIVFGESPLVRSTTGAFETIDFLANVTATDNADDSVVPVCLVDGVDVGSPYDFPADTTLTVSCTATDISGNDSSADFDVTVNFAYTIVIQDLKGNINTGSTAAIDWHYEDPVSGQRVDTSTFSPMVSWLGPYPDRHCGGVSNGEGDGVAAEDSGNSDFRYSNSDFSWRLNWQTPLFAGWYRVTISPPGGDAGSFCEELKK